jgi:O-antigen/teichoic acid export membrane protein
VLFGFRKEIMTKVKNNYFFNLILSVSNILFPILTIPYASRILGPEGMGKVQFVNSFTQYFILLAALGIPIYGTREIAKLKNNKNEIKNLFTSLLIINFITVILLTFIYFILIFNNETLNSDFSFFFISSLALILSIFNIDWLYAGLEKYKFITIRSLFVKFIFLVILYLFVKTKADLKIYLITIIGSTVLNNIWNIVLAREYISMINVNLLYIRKHFKPLLYIFSSIVAASVYSTIDTILLGFIKGFRDVAFYGAASRLIKMTIPILTSLSPVLLPMLTNAYQEKDYEKIKEYTKKSFDFIILLSIPMTFGLFILAPELIRLMSGIEFEPSILSMRIMSPLIMIISFSTVWVLQILLPAGKDFETAISVFIGLVFSIIMNIILIPKYGYIGATITNTIAEFLVMLSFYLFSRKIINGIFDVKLFFKTIICSVFFFPLIYFIRYLFSNNFIIVFVSIFICISWFFLIQIFLYKNRILLDQIKSLKIKFLN